jgi:putative ABC transport system permease protein
MLFEVGPADPITFISVSTILASIALLACFIPARRATQVDPLMSLREQ